MAFGNRRRGRAARSRGKHSSTAKFGTPTRGFARPLWLERLEDRRMLATFTVQNLGDLQPDGDGGLEVRPGSLRAAIVASNANMEPDTILFNENLSGTIQLQSSAEEFGQLLIEGDLSIVGLGARKIGVNAAGGRRVFEITAMGDDIINVSIEGLTISGGTRFGADADGQGGGILNNENLSLTEVRLFNNQATFGGGVFNLGSLNVERSLIEANTAGSHGGGIQNGVLADSGGGGSTEGPPPSIFIVSSTITGNTANTGSGYGGGLFNAFGYLTVSQSTIVGNSAFLGSGIGSQGNPATTTDPPPDPLPDPVVFTTVEGSILFGNSNFVDGAPVPIDIDVVGMGEETGDPPMPGMLDPSINVNGGGNNLIFGLGLQVMPGMGDLPVATNPLFISDLMGVPILADYGGSTNVFHPITDTVVGMPTKFVSPVINKISMGSGGAFDQRGRHFVRNFEEGAMMPRLDIGAVEVQKGSFVVDVLGDEFDDGQYSSQQGVTTVGDFSIREALSFSAKNPLLDTITFNIDDEDDPTLTSAPTILLTNGTLTVNHSVNIVGPDSFILEIDGNGGGLLQVNDGDNLSEVDVLIRNLTLLDGLAISGGAVNNRENLTLDRSTIKTSFASLDGGAIFHDLGTLTVMSSTISGNNSSDDGAVYIAAGSGAVLISNTTISGNFAGDRGAGLFNRGIDTKIEFSTITLNSPGSTRGGGILNFTGGHVEIYSSIISGNVFNNDVDAFAGGVGNVVSLGYNLVGAGNALPAFSAGNGDQFATNPLLEPLAFAGGLTQTHQIKAGSKALDLGDLTPTNPPVNDQRGDPFLRIDPDSNRMDIGAYELQGITFFVDNVGDVNNGNFAMGDVTLREAIEFANISPKKDFINFDVSLLNESISAGNLNITDDVAIIGLGSTVLTLSGSGTVFNINDGAGTLIEVSITGLSLVGRNIVSTEDVFIEDLDIRSNTTSAITHQLGELEIKNSIITGNATNTSGAAINAQNNAYVRLISSTISGNTSNATGSHGGGIFLRNSTLYGYDLVLTGNRTDAGAADGGGLYADNSDVDLALSVIGGNTTNGANSEGAGIFGKNSNINLSYFSTLALNTTFGTSSDGAAVFINGGSLTISDNTNIVLNKTMGQFSSGGAIASVGGDVVIQGVNISQNSTNGADAHGGVVYIQDGSLSVVDSTLFDNATNGLRSDGGAIYSDTNLTGKQTTILNSTISGNTTQDHGGGLYNADGLTVIKYSTITNNAAPYFGFGAGVGSFGNPGTTRTEVGSSIIAGNKVSINLPGNSPTDVDRVGGSFTDTFVSLGYNLVGTGITVAFDNVPVNNHDLFNVADPLLEALANNGGNTLTHALKENSPAVNGGNPSAVADMNGVPKFDQRGENRVKQGRIDIGAFESDFSGAVPGDFNGDGVISGRDFLLWQRGGSPNPLSAGDLANWQANYGSGGTLVAAAVSTEDEFTVELAQLLSDEAAPASSESGVILLGWIMPPAASSAEADVVETEGADRDAAYLAAEENDFGDNRSPFSDLDFGDIATNRSAGNGEDSADLSAEDAVFELIGAGQF